MSLFLHGFDFLNQQIHGFYVEKEQGTEEENMEF